MLEQDAIPFLPVRLDTRMPRDNPRAFGMQLELPESPVRCLAGIGGSRISVLILDQLDALHWSPQHDPSSWAVFLQLITEVLHSPTTVHAVIACRTFDLLHDPTIKAWKNDKDWQLAIEELAIGDMPEESVKPIVEEQGASWLGLSSAQRGLLRKPHLLYLWCKVREESTESPAFHTPTDLLRTFWNHVRKKLRDRNCQDRDINDAIETLVNHLDQSEKLTAPDATMDDWGVVREGLLSLDVIQRADGKLRFVHQSYFEHYLAMLWRKRLRDQGKTVHDWLSENDEQSLLRRGQLRHLLSVLRDDDPKVFLDSLRAILGPNKVRYHLQQMTLQFLGSVADPSPAEVELVRDYLDDHEWRQAIVAQVISGRAPWVRALDQIGLWSQWLKNEDSWKIDMACWLLRSVVETEGNRVAELMGEFVSQPAPWPERVWNALPRQPEVDSDRIFELRLLLARNDIGRCDFCFSEEFSRKYPRRTMDLLVSAFDAKRSNPGTEDEDKKRDREGWPYWLPNHIATAVTIAVEAEPRFAWDELFPCVRLALESRPSSRIWRDEAPFLADSIWHEELYRFDHGQSVALPAILARAGGLWLREDFTEAWSSLQVYSAHQSRTLQQLFGTVLLVGPENGADHAVNWLLSDTRRLSLAAIGGDLQRSLAKALIARFSAICSQQKYEILEAAILRYHPPAEIADAKFRLQFRAGGTWQYSANEYGLAQHSLLAALPVARRSNAVVNEIGQLTQKFGRSTEEFEADAHPKGGWVTSPVASRSARLSDNAWINLISKDPKSRRFRERWFRDHVLESSPEMFARDLWQQAERQPARFAGVALRLPSDAPAAYWASLLRPLRMTRPPDEKNTEWEPATDDQCRQVLEHIGFHNDREVGVAFCNCVAMRPICGISTNVIAAVCQYATEHSDPEHNGCMLPENSKDRLETEAINTVRACAAAALSSLLFEDKTLLVRLGSTIRQLIADNVACVRAAAIGAIIPILNADRNLAVELFLKAVSGIDEEVLCTRNARQFLGYALSSHLNQLEPLICRMASSPATNISEDGAAWTTFAYVYAERCKETFEACRTGSPSQRKGVAQTLANNLEDVRVVLKCNELLPGFFDDKDRDVRNAASIVRHRDVDWSKNADILQKFFRSRAFLDDPRSALWMMEHFTVDLHGLAEPNFSACDTLTNAMKENSSGDRWDVVSAVESLSNLLLRLYGQTHEADHTLRRKCLNRWDAMLRNNQWLPTKNLRSSDKTLY